MHNWTIYMTKLNRHSSSSEDKKAGAVIALFSAELLVVLTLFISLIAFFFLIKIVLIDENHSFDKEIYSLIEPHTNAFTSRIMVIASFIGGTRFMLPANILLTCYFLFIRKHKWYSIKISVIALSSTIILHSLKLLFDRPRPLFPLLEPAVGLSFPSGHAMTSITFFGLIIYFVYKNMADRILKVLLIFLLVCMILIIGYSRIYLRVHYPSDVLAGYSMGTVWLILSLWILNRMEKRKP